MFTTNEWTFSWTMSKPKGFLKDWDSSVFLVSLFLFSYCAPSWDWKTHWNESICNIHLQKCEDRTVLQNAGLKYILLSYRGYWNSTAITLLKYFCRLIKHPSSIKADLDWIQIIYCTHELNIQNIILLTKWKKPKPHPPSLFCIFISQ